MSLALQKCKDDMNITLFRNTGTFVSLKQLLFFPRLGILFVKNSFEKSIL